MVDGSNKGKVDPAVNREDRVISRKSFALGCVAIAASCALDGCASEGNPERKASPSAQYAFWFESSRCIGCTSCVAACREANGTPEDATSRRRVFLYCFADGRERYLSYSCMHCAEAACVKVCPAGAIAKGEGGAVIVDKDRCIGCKYCHQACPFHVPNYLASGMDKCDLCLGAGVPLGDIPFCVSACPAKALHYDTMNKLISASKAEPMDAPGGPSFIVT